MEVNNTPIGLNCVKVISYQWFNQSENYVNLGLTRQVQHIAHINEPTKMDKIKQHNNGANELIQGKFTVQIK